MRTTVEIPDDLRLELIRTAAEAGDKGYSRIVAAALRAYFDSVEEHRRRREAALALFGSEKADGGLSDESAPRGRWRTGGTAAETVKLYNR
jgi:metal-responsive CopG/Arc/MetJ family transcriptional regulator